MPNNAHPQPGFMLIQGNRLEALAEVMTAWLRQHPLSPLDNEIILVQSNGIGQWLKLALAVPPDGEAGGLGIAAAVDLMLPARFIWQVYQAVLGDLPNASAFDKAPLTWRLYRLFAQLDQLAANSVESAWLNAPRAFLASDKDPRRRFQLAERVADLFDQYQVFRADWLADWARGEDTLMLANGHRQPVPDQHRWQPLLWRRLRRDCRQPDAAGESDWRPGEERSRAEIHQRFLQLAKGLTPDHCPETLPPRVIVFGVSALPRQAIDVLDAIAAVTQVMLFVHNPCRHDWGDIVEGRELFRAAYRRGLGRKLPDGLSDDELHLHGHPLLAAWGKQGRDYIRLLDQFDQRERYENGFAAEHLAIDLFEPPGQDSLLHQLQDDILELRPLAERRELGATIDPNQDHSLRFLVAHGPQREVEILHDQLLDAFATAETAAQPLAPRDILVMVPAIETYAPHIEAVFGRLASDDPRWIPFSLSDQGPRQRSPLLLGLEKLLGLPRARCTVTEILDLLDIPALRARLRLAEADVPKLRQWIGGANIRWGLDANHRRAGFGLPDALHQNTWQFGLDRLLLGVASGAAGTWHGVEPYDDVGGLEAALLGPLADLLARLSHYWGQLREDRRPLDWSLTIARLLDDFFTPASDGDEHDLGQVREALEQWTLDCARGGLTDELLPLEVVRDPLQACLDEPNLSRRFLAGAVNFATLMPMRAVPFRQIWLLGMNDGDYPRIRRRADFDLMAVDYRPGDRSRRDDDRYLFLEALLSARERLTISWVGRSIRDNSERPPSVLVGQLRDHVAAGWRLHDGADGRALLSALTSEHPLQPFSRRYFLPNRPAELFTYAAEWHAPAEALSSERTAPPKLSAPGFDGPVTLADLGRFLRHPLKTFYSQRLGAYLGEDAERQEDQEPFGYDGLGEWVLRDILLTEVERRLVAHPDVAPDSALALAIGRLGRSGTLPLAPFDQHWCDALRDELTGPVARYRQLTQDFPRRAPVERIRLPMDDLVLEDNLAAIRLNASGERLRLTLQASRLASGDTLKWHGLVRAWPGHLAAQQQGPTRTRLLSPDGKESEFAPLDWEDAREHLVALLRGYRQGLTELLPLSCKTGFAALQYAADPEKAPAPQQIYDGNDNKAGECADHPGYTRFWPTYAELSQDGRFLELSETLYGPLFNHLQSSTSAGEPDNDG